MRTLSASGLNNFEVSVCMSILASIAVVLRFGVRKSLKQLPSAAEWICLLSLGLFFGYTGVLLHYIFEGSPTGEFNFLLLTSPIEAKNYMKMLFSTELFFGAVITAVKISILFFYHSIFSVSQTFTRISILAGTVCFMWFTIVTCVIVFQCNPVHAFWDTMAQPPYCRSSAKTLLGYEITNLFLDVTILCLPVGMIRKLQLPLSKKVTVAAIFLLGGFVCVASMVRLKYIWNPPNVDISMNVAKVMVWSTVQLGLAIVCSCLPTYGPVFALGGTLVTKFKSLYSSITSSKAGTSSANSRWISKKRSGEDVAGLTWEPIDDQSFGYGSNTASAAVSGDRDISMVPLPAKAIGLKRTVEVV